MSNKERRKVVVAGTFEILHPGHVALISYAKRFGDVWVVVSRDETVRTLRGRDPIIPEDQRRFMIKQIKGVEKVLLGKKGEDKLKIIEEIKPDILILGPDQPYNQNELKAALEARGLKVEVKRLNRSFEDFPLCRTKKIVERIKQIFCKP